MRFPTMWYVQPAKLRSACAYAQSYQSLCWLHECSMNIKLLTEHHLEFLSLTGGCTGWSESTLVKIPHCWKSHVTAQVLFMVRPISSCYHHEGLNIPETSVFMLSSTDMINLIGAEKNAPAALIMNSHLHTFS